MSVSVCLCARASVHLCECLSQCVCVCETASKLGPVGLSAAGPHSKAPSLLLCSPSPWGLTRKDHAACTPPAGGVGDVGLQQRLLALSLSALSSVCSPEVMGLGTGDLPGQRPHWTHGGEGSRKQDSPGEETLEWALSGRWLFSRSRHMSPLGRTPTLGAVGSLLGSQPKES